MKPVFVSHESYQNFVLATDISYVTSWLSDAYSIKGPSPRDPASMLRSYILFLLTNPTIGITKWIDQLHRVPLYAILSGFEPSDIPGVGTLTSQES